MGHILITGGAGYIGSHTNALLNTLGIRTIVLDNLIYGHKEALHFAPIKSSLDANITSFLSYLYNATKELAGGGGGTSPLASLAIKPSSTSNRTALSPKSSQKPSNTPSSLESFAPSIPSLHNAHKLTTFIHADLSDISSLKDIFTRYNIDAVIHFAAFAYVGESVLEPAKYYRNNIAHTLNLLESMKDSSCKHIIFSSTCATYGNPLSLPIAESHPQNPINPYGLSKLVVERMLYDFAKAYGLNYVILRYFNAAGASLIFNIGESHTPETHAIPLLLASSKEAPFCVFGDDYDTHDGSCVRDYIHVDDLASAHILALQHLLHNGSSEVLNLSNNAGFSVFKLIESARHITQKPLPYKREKRREGDPSALIGDSTKARKLLGWMPHFADIDVMLASAWRWEQHRRY